VTRPGDDAERSDEVGVPPAAQRRRGEQRHDCAGDDAEHSDGEEWRHDPAGDGGAGSSPQAGGTPTPAPENVWKSFRGVMAGTLILEAIVVLLALPVVGTVGGGLTSAALGFLIGLAGVLVLMAGLQGRSWAIWMNLAVQLVPIVGFVVYPGLGFIGALFAAVWALIAYFRAEVRRRERRGLLPGQGARPDGLGQLRYEAGTPRSGGVPPPACGRQRPPD
jgi:uncharacterized protein DUF4233